MRAFVLVVAFTLAGCGNNKADDAAEKERFQRAVKVEAKRLVDEALPNPHEAKPATEPTPAAKKRSEQSAQPGCWDDYCPCDEGNPDFGGADVSVCRNLKMGVEVSDDIMAGAAAMRDARRSLREWNRDNPEF